MEEAFFFAVLVLGALFVLPGVAIAIAARARKSTRSLRRDVVELRQRLADAEHRGQTLEHRLAAWVDHFEGRLRAGSTAAPAATPSAAPVPEQPRPSAAAVPEQPRPSAAAEERVTASAQEPAPVADDPARASSRDAAAARREWREALSRASEAEESVERAAAPAWDWERVVGVRLFAWLGGGALFLAAVLFLHYSIQRELISPAVRVAIGLGVGALCLWGGDRLRERTRLAGEALSGAGVAILYAALFAARSLYGLIDSRVAFAGMALVTLTSGLLAVRRDAFFVALLGLLGGMATPYLLSSGEDRPLALFGYVALLGVGIVAVARRRSWPSLALLGLFGSVVVFAGWSATYLVASRAPYALLAVALIAGLFVLARPTSFATDPVPRVIAALGAALPLGTAVVFAGSRTLDVEPWLLAGYLLLVSAGGWLAVGREHAAWLPSAAAVLSLLALTLRVDDRLFPARRELALASFALVPAGHLVAWLVSRRTEHERALRRATTLALAGAPAVVLAVLAVETETEPIAALALYAFAQALGLIGMAALARDGRLVCAGHVLSLVALLSLSVARFESGRLSEFVPFVALSGLGFWSLPLLGSRWRPDRAAWLSSAVALPVHAALLYALAREIWRGGPLGAIAVLAAGLSVVSLRVAGLRVADDEPRRLELQAIFGALALAFVTASVPLLLDKEWITISWAAEVAALAWLVRRVPHRGLVVAQALLAAAVTVRLLFNPAVWQYHPRSATPILNHHLYTFGVPALAFFLAAHLVRHELAERYKLASSLRVAATTLLFVLLNVQIADFYSRGHAFTFRFTGGGLAQDMTYSLAWGAFALALLTFGIVRRHRSARIGALVVLVLTVGKVFLHDLWELGSLYRVGSIVGLAIALLGVSFLTQRFILPANEKEKP